MNGYFWKNVSFVMLSGWTKGNIGKKLVKLQYDYSYSVLQPPIQKMIFFVLILHEGISVFVT